MPLVKPITGYPLNPLGVDCLLLTWGNLWFWSAWAGWPTRRPACRAARGRGCPATWAASRWPRCLWFRCWGSPCRSPCCRHWACDRASGSWAWRTIVRICFRFCVAIKYILYISDRSCRLPNLCVKKWLYKLTHFHKAAVRIWLTFQRTFFNFN